MWEIKSRCKKMRKNDSFLSCKLFRTRIKEDIQKGYLGGEFAEVLKLLVSSAVYVRILTVLLDFYRELTKGLIKYKFITKCNISVVKHNTYCPNICQ